VAPRKLRCKRERASRCETSTSGAFCLVQPDHLPPNGTDTEEGGNVKDRQTEPNLPPGGEIHVSGTKERGRRANAVVSSAAHDVREDTEHEGRHQRRGTASHEHGEEGSVHGANVRSTRSKHVVGVEVQEHNYEEGRLPSEASSRDNLNDSAGKPRDETILVEVSRHGNQGSKPGQGVPSGAFSEALLPGDDTRDEKGRQANESSGHGTDADGGSENPEPDSDDKGGGHDLLVATHGAELLELFPSLDRSLRRVLHLGRVQDVQDEGHGNQADEARKGGSERPLSPSDRLTDGRSGEVNRERVRRHRSDEHTGRNSGSLEHSGHHVRAHLFLCPLVRFRTARHAERLGQGQENATRARRERGDSGSENRLGKDEGVGQAEGGLAEGGHDEVCDPVAKARLDEAARQEECQGNKPRNLRGERAERSGEREEARDHRDAETDKGGGAKRERLQYQRVERGPGVNNTLGLDERCFGRRRGAREQGRTLVMMPTIVPTKTARRCHACAETPSGAGMHQMMRPARTEKPRGLSLAPFHSVGAAD